MQIGIIGLGLIGGSLGRSLIAKTDNTVYGFDISADTVLKAQFMSAIHRPLDAADYPYLDILIVALNPRAAITVLEDISPRLKDGAIVLDIGGNKANVIKAMKGLARDYPKINYIGTHPMAGREFSGINHATISLFDRASVLMINVNAEMETLTCIKKLFLSLGFANVILTDDLTHDKIIAYSSQLAHIISSSYICSPTAKDHDGFSAGSFRDLSRVAKMNASMWAELICDNKENVLSELDTFLANILAFREAISENNQQKLLDLFEKGNANKEAIDKNSREWKRNNND